MSKQTTMLLWEGRQLSDLTRDELIEAVETVYRDAEALRGLLRSTLRMRSFAAAPSLRSILTPTDTQEKT